MNNAFREIENIYCINLDRRTDRWEIVQQEFEKIGILDKVKRFSAIEHQDGRIGLIKSFLELFKMAKRENMKNILIFEDDVKFINNPIDVFNKSYDESFGVNWGLFYLGANTHEKIKKFSPNLCLLKNAYSAHAIIYDEMVFDDIIERFEKTDKITSIGDINDVFYSTLQDKYISIMTNPLIATQYPSYSDLEKKNVNYTFIEERFKNNIK